MNAPLLSTDETIRLLKKNNEFLSEQLARALEEIERLKAKNEP